MRCWERRTQTKKSISFCAIKAWYRVHTCTFVIRLRNVGRDNFISIAYSGEQDILYSALSHDSNLNCLHILDVNMGPDKGLGDVKSITVWYRSDANNNHKNRLFFIAWASRFEKHASNPCVEDLEKVHFQGRVLFEWSIHFVLDTHCCLTTFLCGGSVKILRFWYLVGLLIM